MVKVSQKDKKKTACGSLLLCFKINKNGTKTESARLKAKPLPLPPLMGLLACGLHPKLRWQWLVGSIFEALKTSSSWVPKRKFYLEVKLAAWHDITYPWKFVSRSTWDGSQDPARIKNRASHEAAACGTGSFKPTMKYFTLVSIFNVCNHCGSHADGV